MSIKKEGNLEAPKREPIPWQTEEYSDSESLDKELERVFDICHGCRRCVNLCNAFPTLFDLIDESATMEVDGVQKSDYMNVVDECYLCDLCAETKCPYLPPHEWAVDFPHLMLRAKVRKFKAKNIKLRDRILTSTELLFKVGSIPGISAFVNASMSNPFLRALGERTGRIHKNAPLPKFARKTFQKQWKEGSVDTNSNEGVISEPRPSTTTTGRVAIYVTCYGNYNEPDIVEALVKVLLHNDIEVQAIEDVRCCGMPKLELGDLDSVAAYKDANVPILKEYVNDGFDLMSVIPSCTLMYRQEIPLLFPDDADVFAVKEAFFDPFEYLILRHKEGLINQKFKQSLGKVTYHAACHQRVQNIGRKTQDFLSLIPDTEVKIIERCSGHNGTYAVKSESYQTAMKIARPVVRNVQDSKPDTWGSDCPMAGRLIQHSLDDDSIAVHPLQMVSRAYGLD